MKRQFQLNDVEVEQVRQAEQQTRDVHELKRLQAVRLYGSGMSIGQIMDIHSCGETPYPKKPRKCPGFRLCCVATVIVNDAAQHILAADRTAGIWGWR